MSHSTTPSLSYRFSPRVTLAALGIRLQGLHLFGPVQERVHIAQKTITHTPVQTWSDACIAILAGAHGLVEINKRLRSDPSLQAAFGRPTCAEPSGVQETLDACTEGHVEQRHRAMDDISRRHSWGYRHDYGQRLQVLDAEMTGIPCGPKAACATKGSFAKQRHRRGRQLGRVLATRYGAIVVDRLFPGTTQRTRALPPLVQATEQTLELDEATRRRTVWRLEAGGGSVGEVNWLLDHGYHVHWKDYSSTRAQTLAESVTEGVDDPRIAERQVGWVTVAPTAYSRPVRRVAVRCRKKNGQWGVGVLISTMAPDEVIVLARQPVDRMQDLSAVLLAYVSFYDQRGGGVETSMKGDKQGVGVTKRHKKRLAAQQMVTQRNALAHHTIVWARQWLTPYVPRMRRWGIMRMVREVFHVSGQIVFDHRQSISPILLNPADPLARGLAPGLFALLGAEHVVVNLGKT